MSRPARYSPRLEIRRLEPADGPAALGLADGTALEGDLPLRFDRGPDFFAWPDALLDRWVYAGAFEDTRLLGYGLVGFRRGWTGDRWGAYAFSGDLRVAPEARRAGVGAALLRAIQNEIPPDVHLVAGTILRGNRHGLGLARDRMPSGFSLTDLGEFVSITRLARRCRATGPVVRLGVQDVPAVQELLATGPHGLFAPEPTEREAHRLLEPDPRLAGGAWGVWDGSRLRGLVALLDLDRVRRAIVLREPVPLSIVRHAFGLAGYLLGTPSLPGPGQPLRALTVARLVVPAGLRGSSDSSRLNTARVLVQAARLEAFARGAPLLHLGLHGADPLRAAADRGLRHRHGLRLFASVDQRGGPAVCPTAEAPPALDSALV